MRKIITTTWVTLDGYIAHEVRNELIASRRHEEEGGEKGRILVKREKKVSP